MAVLGKDFLGLGTLGKAAGMDFDKAVGRVVGKDYTPEMDTDHSQVPGTHQVLVETAEPGAAIGPSSPNSAAEVLVEAELLR